MANGSMEWEQLKELIKLKKENPEEYKVLLKDIVEIMVDLQGAVEEVMDKVK